MKHAVLLSVLAGAAMGSFPLAAMAADPEQCTVVRLAEPGWNDLAFTTGIATVLLQGLGYEPKSTLLGIDVIYQSLANKDLDVFLGYWDPAMVNYYKPHKESGAVESVRVNLEGAKYTFAVPTYAWEAGVKDAADLHKFADKFGSKMYGIEPGSNQLMLDVINDPAFAISNWKLVESSEQGMLAEVARKTADQEFILFQGWAPHPMNVTYNFKYLTGLDKYYGPDFGAATVSTQVRKGYLAECPNVGKLLQNLSFDIDFENKGMGYLINDGAKPEEAATRALKEDPSRLEAWLAGVTTRDGGDGLAAVKQKLGL